MRFKIKYFDLLRILMTLRVGTNKIDNVARLLKIIISFSNLPYLYILILKFWYISFQI